MEVLKREGLEGWDGVFAGEDVEMRGREEDGCVVLVWRLVWAGGRERNIVFAERVFAGAEGFFENVFGGFWGCLWF